MKDFLGQNDCSYLKRLGLVARKSDALAVLSAFLLIAVCAGSVVLVCWCVLKVFGWL